jgi:hypothetical protein
MTFLNSSQQVYRPSIRDYYLQGLGFDTKDTIETGNTCNWNSILIDEFMRNNLEISSLRDVSNQFINELFARLKINRNTYLFVGGELGTGKSFLAITLAYILDPDFSYDKIVFDIEDFARCLKEYRENFSLVWDEAGDYLNAQNWQSIKGRKEIRDVFVSQRELKINVFLTARYLGLLEKVIRNIVDYIAFIRYRCPYHAHGFLYKTETQVSDINANLKGTIMLAKSVYENEPRLRKIIERYQQERKRPYMFEKQEILINLLDFNKKKQEELINKFLEFAKEKNIDVNKVGSKKYFEAWLVEQGYDDSNTTRTVVESMWARIKFKALIEGE